MSYVYYALSTLALVGLFVSIRFAWKYARVGLFQAAGGELLAAFIMLILALLTGSKAAEAGTLDLEVSVGANLSDKITGRFDNSDGGFTGPRDLVEFAIKWESADRKWFVTFSHISHLSCGFPFGECKQDQAFRTVDGFAVPAEAFLDRIMFGRRFRLLGGH